MFFTVTLVGTIVEQTNIYARQVLGEHRPWKYVTEEDIWAFFGFCILMGINRLQALRHYWSNDPHFHYQPVAGYISRKRFMDIWRFLHFCDNSVVQSGANNGVISSINNGATSSTGNGASSSSPPDRLCKIRPVISTVLAACRTHYRPNREQSIDEAMVAFKGRSTMKQYIPNKPVKRGFKIWVRADSHNGFICEFECYTGKKGVITEVGLGGSVVTRLTRDLVGKNYHIYMDNFLSSVSLYKNLLLDNIYCTGTLQVNRRNFPPVLKKVVKKGLAKLAKK